MTQVILSELKEPCPNLAKIGFPHAPVIAEWLTLRARSSILSSSKGTKGLVPTAVANAGYLIPDADTVGASTGRWRHKGIVNIPRVTSAYGKEMRSLFKAREGYNLVGWDASSLEAHIEAHYIKPWHPEMAEALESLTFTPEIEE